MKNRIEMNGASVDEAVENALKELGVSREDVEVIVVREAAKGFLGIGAKDAQVIVTVKNEENAEDDYEDDFAGDEPEEEVVETEEYEADEQDETDEIVANEDNAAEADDAEDAYEADSYDTFCKEAEEIAVSFLEELFEKATFDINVEVDREASDEKEIYIRLTGSEVGLTIGRRGETLDALQYLTNLALSRKIGMGTKVVVDVENCREKRRETLVLLAERLEKKVIRTRRSVKLEPMNPYERRIIHATLQSSRQVETYSVGTDPNRMVVIDLKGRRRD